MVFFTAIALMLLFCEVIAIVIVLAVACYTYAQFLRIPFSCVPMCWDGFTVEVYNPRTCDLQCSYSVINVHSINLRIDHTIAALKSQGTNVISIL